MSRPDGEDLWERHAGWWQEGFTEAPTPSTWSRSSRWRPRTWPGPPGARHRLRRGPGQPAGSRRRGRGRRRRRPDLGPGHRGPRRGGAGLRRAGAAALPFRRRPSTTRSPAWCSSTSATSTTPSPRSRGCWSPGGRFLFFLNHPLLQTPSSGWIDDQVLDPPEQYWRIGPYLVEDETVEEVEKGVFIPFIHRPLSRYVNAIAANGLVISPWRSRRRRRVPGPGGGVPGRGDHPSVAPPRHPADPRVGLMVGVAGRCAGAVLFAVGFGFCLRTGIEERNRVADALDGLTGLAGCRPAGGGRGHARHRHRLGPVPSRPGVPAPGRPGRRLVLRGRARQVRAPVACGRSSAGASSPTEVASIVAPPTAASACPLALYGAAVLPAGGRHPPEGAAGGQRTWPGASPAGGPSPSSCRGACSSAWC